ncbi:hypothetical protein HCBG_08884 [Histoplasma capsulatum G186AR]|uniref:Uncharacterized protein n=1 Tax=Ajellomyces capsulatus (strain G186AR / H82 / ATCC MYA-2454 / RMSCC 2432) TaxID=447093 RepID=C0P042_AJECG|nr:uncharacterized protein HCBG_08884 [Histoplasma capsulatum G186AR]EEH02981.1 hypothetical protein HCBG_08884 [Histoplasma capsulatum G186AR]
MWDDHLIFLKWLARGCEYLSYPPLYPPIVLTSSLKNQIGILFHKGSPSGKEKFDTTLPRSCYIPTMSPRTSEMLRMRAYGDSKNQPAQFAKTKHLFLRQDVVKCQTELGRGDCVEAGSCRGFFETDRTLCPQGDGPKEPWPCIGPNDVQCCVKNENINNNSSVSTSHSTTSSTTFSLPLATPSIPTTTTIPPTATPTTSTSPQPLSRGSAGLSTGAKGGIAGGIAAGVLIIGLIAVLFFVLGRQRNANIKIPAAEEGRLSPLTAAGKRQEENTVTEKDDDTCEKPELLGGSPLSELPANFLTGELDSSVLGGKAKSDAGESTLAAAQERSRAPVELPADA